MRGFLRHAVMGSRAMCHCFESIHALQDELEEIEASELDTDERSEKAEAPA